MSDMINGIALKLLDRISSWKDNKNTAYSIRQNGSCAAINSTEHIRLERKENGKGLDVYIAPGTIGEKVYIPACVTKGGINDVVYNDFHVGEGADVTIEAGCGIHTETSEGSLHSGVHRFFLDKNSKVLYEEKHIGVGSSEGKKNIDPVAYVQLGEGSVLEMDTVQIGGIQHSLRKTSGTVGKNAKLIIHESIMTEDDDYAKTDFHIKMEGENSIVDLISRSVAKGNSYQEYHSKIEGNTRCTGHSECDAILVDNGRVNAAPELLAADLNAALIHEAAIGKVAGEQIIKLMTLGLTEKEAENKIIEGFLLG